MAFDWHIVYSIGIVAATLAAEHYGYPPVRAFVLRVFGKTQSAAKAEADALRAKAHAVEVAAGIVPFISATPTSAPPPAAPSK
jgi:hypothetical protein